MAGRCMTDRGATVHSNTETVAALGDGTGAPGGKVGQGWAGSGQGG